jgi:dTDP-glucose 4,6-dehydratase
MLLVTGGAGFIGSALIRRLLSTTDHHVVNVDKLTYAGNLESLGPVSALPSYHFVRADIADAHAMRQVMEEFRPHGVIHLAAESHVDRSIDGPSAFVSTNIVGTYVLLQEALRHWRGLTGPQATAFRFVHVSTDEVFGELGDTGAFTEKSPYRPNSPYSASKAASDHLARAWHRTYGLPVVTTNCTNNYGPYQFPEKLIPLTIRHALANRPIPVYGRGANVRDWLHVDDHAGGLLAALEAGRPGESYLFGGSSERRNLDVVHAICDLVDALAPGRAPSPRRSLVRFVADRPGHDHRYAADASRATRELGWRPTRSFESGLRDTVAWYLENAEWCDRVESGAYRGERLGLGAGAP